MCGIAGFIGKALHPKATYALMTQLALKTEFRGPEATGIWGASSVPSSDTQNDIIYHKEPIKASKFVETPMWRQLKQFNPNILLVHCREPTQTAGPPNINKNNHPHVSEDYTVALIHNGKVDEYYKYKSKFDKSIKSQCDSELILHLFRTGEYMATPEKIQEKYSHLHPDNLSRLWGIEEIYKRLESSMFACAVGERESDTKRSLWLFRNSKRPLQVIDLRETMGQIFFCSLMSIWRDAVDQTPEVKNIIPQNHKVMEFPCTPPYAYAISFDPSQPNQTDDQGHPVSGSYVNGWKIHKYKLEIDKEEGEEEELVIPANITQSSRSVRVLTKLDKDDIILNDIKRVIVGSHGTPDVSVDSDGTASVEITYEIGDPGDETPASNGNGIMSDKTNTKFNEDINDFDTSRLEELVKIIKEMAESIGVSVYNDAIEGNISNDNFSEILDGLEQARAEMVAVQFIANRLNKSNS